MPPRPGQSGQRSQSWRALGLSRSFASRPPLYLVSCSPERRGKGRRSTYLFLGRILHAGQIVRDLHEPMLNFEDRVLGGVAYTALSKSHYTGILSRHVSFDLRYNCHGLPAFWPPPSC